MIGRDRELANIHHFIKDCKAGQPGMLFIAGPAGIGKTTLVQRALRQAPDCFTVETQIFETTNLPYGPVVNALRHILQAFPQIRQELKLIHHLHLLLPEIEKPAETADQATMIAAIREVFCAVAQQQPLIFLIDDVHWADAATLELILPLLESMGQARFALIATYHNDTLSRDHRLTWLKTNLRRSRYFREITLPAFTREETEKLLMDCLQQPVSNALVTSIHQHTQGLPFFIEELAQSLQEKNYLLPSEEGLVLNNKEHLPLPDTIRDMIVLQLDNLSTQALALLEVAAIIGQEVEFELLNELCEDTAAIEELLKHQIIHEKSPGIGAFKHNLVWETVKKEILWTRRKELNHQIATALEHRNAPAELTGEFWLNAGEGEKARLAFWKAARHYCAIHAYRDSAAAAHKALELWPKEQEEPQRLEVLKQLANCAQMSGQIHDAIMALREMIESPLLQDDFQKQGDTYRSLSIAYALQGTWNQFQQCCKAAAQAYEKAGSWADASREWHELANRYTDALQLIPALEAAENAVQCALKADKTDLHIKALSNKGYLLSIQGKIPEAQQVSHEAISMALSGNHVEVAAYAYRKLAGVLEYASDFKGSLKAYDTALNLCRTQDLDFQAQMCMSCMSWVLFRMGDWKKSLEVCKEIIEDAEINDASKSTAHLVSGLIRLYRGETKTAHKHIQQSATLVEKENFHIILLILHWASAALQESEAHATDAYQQYCTMLADWQKLQDRHDVLPGLCSAVIFFSENGHKKEVDACARIFSFLANDTGNPEAVGGLALALGEIALMAQKYEMAGEHLDQARQYFIKLSTPLQLIQITFRLGMALYKAEKRDSAKKYLQEALQEARKLGLRPMASAMESILERFDNTVAEKQDLPKAPQNPAGLTRRQLEIMQELAKGLSNKEIAAQLHLSTRTVDMHVSNILDNLNCRTRTEAVKVAVEQGLVN